MQVGVTQSLSLVLLPTASPNKHPRPRAPTQRQSLWHLLPLPPAGCLAPAPFSKELLPASLARLDEPSSHS